MKIYDLLLFGVIVISSFGCTKDEGASKVIEKDPVKITIQTGMSLAQMNAVIASATVGETVWVQSGTYLIDGKLMMKPGVVLQQETSDDPVFDATGMGSEIFTMSYVNELNNCVFKGITFHNVRFSIEGSKNVEFISCTFDYGKRKMGTDKNFYRDAYIHLIKTDSAIIDKCNFFRREENSGRAIWNTGASNSQIINNTIGDGEALGYFVTAINETETHTTIIKGNVIQRNSLLNSNPSQTDHGIYAHSFDGVLIEGNEISGWPCTASGGAIKARNGQNISIYENILNDSGILLNEYDMTSYQYLKKVDISNNIINIPEIVNDSYHGISYWRNNAKGTEYSIRVANNIMPNGTIYIMSTHLNISGFNAENGGVYSNNVGKLSLKEGIININNY